MKTLLFLFALFLPSIPVAAQNIRVPIDFESVEAVDEALSKKDISEAQIEKIAALGGNRGLIAKMTSLKVKDAENVFKTILREVIKTGKIAGGDPFKWQLVRRNLPAIKSLTTRIEREKPVLLADLNKLIAPFTPPDLKADVKARLFVVGASLGFTLGRRRHAPSRAASDRR